MEESVLFLTPEEVAEKIGALIKEHRLRLNYKQAEFAERLGIPLSTYRRFEKNGQITLTNLIAILAGIGKKDVLTKALQLDDIEAIGIDAFLEGNNDTKSKKRSR